MPAGATIDALLRGRDSPQKFAAANVLLAFEAGEHTGEAMKFADTETDGSYILGAYEFSLRLHSRDDPPDGFVFFGDRSPSAFRSFKSDGEIHVLAAELKRIRRMWHDALDVRVLNFSYFWIIALLWIVPITRLARFATVHRRRHRGRCAKCGYDLRATPSRCPECGVSVWATD